ncbi:DMT family transporter [Sinosporangium album]|nr:multidrug efflux SMR transporter [Sinosporangium album]
MRRETLMAWLLLTLAIVTEVIATSALKLSDGLSHRGYTVVVVLGYVASYVALARALKLQLEVSLAYAIWSGVGTAAIAVIGAMFFHESVSVLKTVAIVLIIAGVAMLNLAPTPHTATGRVAVVTARPDAAVALVRALGDLTGAITELRAAEPSRAVRPHSVADAVPRVPTSG